MTENKVCVGFDTYSIEDLDTIIKTAELTGVTHIDLHQDCWGAGIPSEAKMLSAIEMCKKKGWTYVINIEGAQLGWDLTPAMMAAVRESGLCKGVLLDECDWQHINAHWVLPQTDGYRYHEKHYFGETEGLSLEEAYEKVYQEANRRNMLYLKAGLPRLASEHLYPVMMHTLARAGFAVSPKVLKETWGPVMLAVALGAAKQYGTDLWTCVDEWWHPELFGHPMRRYRSAFLLAYWLGASVIHTEGGRFLAPQFNHMGIEEQGQILREFATDYLPTHPRPYSCLDVKPTTAIIRFDDTCFDIRQRTLGEYPGPLYGHIPAGEVNTEWLTIWNLLSHGYLRSDSISHNWETKLPAARSLFAPLNNVVVYDHLAGDKDLDGLNFIFLSGVKISEATFTAVERHVKAGATCVTPLRFLPPSAKGKKLDAVTVIPDGLGKWVTPKEWDYLHYECWTNGPRLPELRKALEGVLGAEDRLQYTFGDHQVIGKMFAGDADVLEFDLR